MWTVRGGFLLFSIDIDETLEWAGDACLFGDFSRYN